MHCNYNALHTNVNQGNSMSFGDRMNVKVHLRSSEPTMRIYTGECEEFHL